MIKILLNGNEVIEFSGNMDLRIGQEIKILGCKYYIKDVKSTREHVKVEVGEELKCSIKIDGKALGMGVLNSGHINTKASFGRNPFDR